MSQDSASRKISAAEGLFREGKLAQAEDVLRGVLERNARHSRAHEILAYVLGQRGDLAGVEAHLLKATESPTATATAWYYLGVCHRTHGRLPQAIAAFQRALSLHAAFYEALHDLGAALHDAGHPQEAIEAFNRAAALNAGSFEVFVNRGRAFHALHRYDEALADYERARQLNPQSPELWLNRGEVLNDLRRYDECLECYETARRLRPGYADAQWNESLTRLLLGQFEAGWEKYEARWLGPRGWPRRHLDLPPWTATAACEGKTVLVWWEQGYGDTLQFCRYAPLLAERGARVVLEVQPALRSLLRSLPNCEVVADGEPLPACHYQIPLLSLPLQFGTTLQDIPAKVPYLAPAPERISHWARRLPARARPRIGIAWSGHAAQKDNRPRSIPARDFRVLAQFGDLFLIPPGLDERDRSAVNELGIEYVGDDVRDFEDSAAIVTHMDLVVTIDTSLAHLAGALARPTWVLLPWTPTWRWLVERADSPWYPTMRLFRQTVRGDWEGVFKELAAELSQGVPGCC